MKVWLSKKDRIEYYENTLKNPPSPFLVKVLEKGNFTTALDLGCGAGVDAKEMARRGIKVTAIDINPEIKNYFKKDKNIKLVVESIEEFNFQTYDLIFAKSVLPFLNKVNIIKTVNNIKMTINPGGIFAGRFFGPNDSFNKGNGKMTFVTKDELLKMFEDFKILEIVETEKDGTTGLGKPKHWHIIDIIVKKPDS
jgi:SAM-dependent methyltransferase